MRRCLQIYRAYSFKFIRKYSTIILIAFLLIALFVIFRLHAHAHHKQQTVRKVGDFNYTPGLFLKGRQPTNESFCDFHYGLPDNLKWGTFDIHPSPGAARNEFSVIYNVITGTTFAHLSKVDAVTYVTQATPEFLYHIVEIARYWDGPISLSLFVPNYDLDLSIQIITHLCSCYVGMAKVSLHLIYPNKHPPKMRSLEERQKIRLTTETPPTTPAVSLDDLLQLKIDRYSQLTNKTRAEYVQWVMKNKAERVALNMPNQNYEYPNLRFEDCSGTESSIRSYRKSHLLTYPINVGRNAARNATLTNYFLVSDIEMVPSYGLATKFLKMVRKLMGDKERNKGYVFSKTVFVVPLFEVERGERIPHDKVALINMVSTNRARYFHQKVCAHCQRFPGMQTWLMRRPHTELEPMMISKRVYPYHRWEPLYFGTHNDPLYSELLTWEGFQDKMTQMLELCLEQYLFVILDGGFLCHAASDRKHYSRNRAQRENRLNYKAIIKEFVRKYEYRKQVDCRIDFGCPLKYD